MRKSILTDDLEHSFLSGKPTNVVHHIYGGTGRRKISEREGFIVPLTPAEHNMSNEAVHFNKELDLYLKRLCQKKYEDLGHTRHEFITLIGRNYLGEENEDGNEERAGKEKDCSVES